MYSPLDSGWKWNAFGGYFGGGVAYGASTGDNGRGGFFGLAPPEYSLITAPGDLDLDLREALSGTCFPRSRVSSDALVDLFPGVLFRDDSSDIFHEQNPSRFQLHLPSLS